MVNIELVIMNSVLILATIIGLIFIYIFIKIIGNKKIESVKDLSIVLFISIALIPVVCFNLIKSCIKID